MKLGIIGGSGLYGLSQLQGAHRHAQETPWGWPSDVLLEGEIEGLPVVFLPRHGPRHAIAPHEINYRANVAALKAMGCTAVVSIAACGSFTDDLPPGALAVPHQIVDRTQGRAGSFFGDGLVAHVSLADPIATELADAIMAAATGIGAPAKAGGTYLAVQGLRFATRAESRLAKAEGMDIVGMTAMPEAALCREAEMAYAVAAFVTDFDSWKDEAVTSAAVLEVMAANRTRSQMLVAALCARLAKTPLPIPSREGWEQALDHAIVTPRAAWPTQAAAHLRAIAPRLFA
ncbi:MTAP family purine nucleoside phosphorylase [Sandaracinobacter neustonicus]|nr:MTAP family purine nucleoside phosphorylase [Sandaracinobacter neustonicus]